MKIVIVEDNISFSKTLNFFVENKLGYKIDKIYHNPVEFIDSLKSNCPDLVLMDIHMPELTGVETTKMALWKWDSIKVIAVTNMSEEIFLDQLIKAGFKGCVLKDDLYNDLPDAINEVMNGKLFFPKIKL